MRMRPDERVGRVGVEGRVGRRVLRGADRAAAGVGDEDAAADEAGERLGDRVEVRAGDDRRGEPQVDVVRALEHPPVLAQLLVDLAELVDRLVLGLDEHRHPQRERRLAGERLDGLQLRRRQRPRPRRIAVQRAEDLALDDERGGDERPVAELRRQRAPGAERLVRQRVGEDRGLAAADRGHRRRPGDRGVAERRQPELVEALDVVRRERVRRREVHVLPLVVGQDDAAEVELAELAHAPRDQAERLLQRVLEHEALEDLLEDLEARGVDAGGGLRGHRRTLRATVGRGNNIAGDPCLTGH